jgi:transposase-like protein
VQFFVVKYTGEDKLAAIQRYLAGNESYNEIATSIGTSDSVIRNWVMQYKEHGMEILTEKSYTSYSAQFKLDVLNYMNNNGTSPNKTAAVFNISSPGLVRKWRNQFEIGGIDALKLKKKGLSNMDKKSKENEPIKGSKEALEAENERLRMENAYLKKLHALIQEKEKSQNRINMAIAELP